jgi:hypothetical protein
MTVKGSPGGATTLGEQRVGHVDLVQRLLAGMGGIRDWVRHPLDDA